MNKEIDLFLFRHGETDWNIQKRFQGHLDVPLNENGRDQARNLKGKIESLDLDVIVSSDLSRAHETVLISTASLDVEVIKDKALREAYLGEPEGLLRDEIIQKYGQTSWSRWCSVENKDLDFCYPKGETKKQQLERAKIFLENYMLSSSYSRIGISTHSGVVRRLCHFAKNSPLEAVPVPNCIIYHLRFDGSDWYFVGAV